MLADRGFGLVIPGYGALGRHKFSGKAKFIEIKDGFAIFNDVKLLLRPVIGTIGVAPYGDPIPTAVPYKHGGNLDCTEVTKGARLYLPVATDGALFAAGDIHAVQGDGELCVAAVEISGKMLFKFDVIKGMQPNWPVVEYGDHYSILTSDESLEKAVELATMEAVNAIMNSTGWGFEEAYMFSSLAVDIRINQVVDPKKGVRAVIPKNIVSIKDFLHG
jgi:amidase